MRDRVPAAAVSAVLGALSVTAVIVVAVMIWPGRGSELKVGTAAADPRPNIVFVLTDDLDWSLVTARYMPHVVALERAGVTFTHYIVADSLCCPSRASIFTGDFPHDTGVLSNFGAHGGFQTFYARGDERRTFAVALRKAGYLTAMMGKYLNGYMAQRGHSIDGSTSGLAPSYIPPGWTEWDAAGWGYPEFDYDLNQNGRLVHYGPGPPPKANAANYLSDVLAGRATKFIDRAARLHRPFLMEVATFAPHSPYTPAPRNARDFGDLRAPRDPSFNVQNSHPPDWLGKRRKLTAAQVRRIDADYRKRARAVEAVDRLVGKIEQKLKDRGMAQSTYIVFSSDNGYHMGQHRLLPGKETAFDTDIRVPLIVAGPGVQSGRVVPNVAQNTDLYPTFVGLATGARANTVDGHSLVPLLRASASTSTVWRTVALVEHHGPSDKSDPDLENAELGGNPATYEAIRISDRQFGNAVYVEYRVTGVREYYSIDTDPYEIHNSYRFLTQRQRWTLHRILVGLERCHRASTCWAAAQPQPQ